MLVYCGNGQAHLLCYRPRRPIIYAPQHESAPALGGQGVEDRLQVSQFVTCFQPCLRTVVYADQVEVGDHLERDDLAAPRGIDHQIARDLVQIGAAGLQPTNIAGSICAGHCLCDHIIDVRAIGQHSSQPRAQRALVGQDGLFIPFEPGSD